MLGANRFSGSAHKERWSNQRLYGATSLNGDLQLELETSFNEQDSLMTVLLAGNVSAESNAFGGASPTNSGNWKQHFRPMTTR